MMFFSTIAERPMDPTRAHDQHGAELTTRSFHLSCLPSPWWSWSWVELRNEHDAAKRLMERHQDASKMVTFKNTLQFSTAHPSAACGFSENSTTRFDFHFFFSLETPDFSRERRTGW
jgi:hypothetical protein